MAVSPTSKIVAAQHADRIIQTIRGFENVAKLLEFGAPARSLPDGSSYPGCSAQEIRDALGSDNLAVVEAVLGIALTGVVAGAE